MANEVNTEAYQAEKFQSLLKQLLKRSGESYRQASKAARLDSSAISRYMRGTQPARDACVALADHFGVSPNDMLVAASYERMSFFDPADLEGLSPEVRDFAQTIQEIEDLETRQQVIWALKDLLQACLPSSMGQQASPCRASQGAEEPV